jgi:hypothetical protein
MTAYRSFAPPNTITDVLRAGFLSEKDYNGCVAMDILGGLQADSAQGSSRTTASQMEPSSPCPSRSTCHNR